MTAAHDYTNGHAAEGAHTNGEAQRPFRVVIVGAGIAGLATAIALRASGREIVVLEASRMKSEIGAAIHLAPNATKIVNKWGLDIKTAARGTVCREIREIDGCGVIKVKAPVDTEKAFGAPWLFQHRVDLHSAIRDFSQRDDLPGPPPKIVTSAKVTAIDVETGIITTADGTTYQGDLIVGADGIHSVVRSAVLGSIKVAQPSGHSAYRTLIPKEKIMHIPEAIEGLTVEHSIMQIIVQGDRRVILYPCREASIANIVAICPDAMMNEQSSQAWNQEGSAADLVASFHDFPQWVVDLLSHAEKPGLWQLRDQDPLTTWVKGRAVVVGDAAHAMLPHQGQGAGQGIEDAEAIGAFFEGVTGPLSTEAVNTLLQDVFNARYKRATLIQAYSRQQAKPVGSADRVDLNAMQFAGYNMSYNGVRDWIKQGESALRA